MAVGAVILNLKGMEKFRREIRSSLQSTVSGPMLDVRKQWAERYRSEMTIRYNKFARGGGNWPSLKPGTIAGRRTGKKGGFKRGKRARAKAKAKGGGQISILIDNGQLIKALSPVFTRLPGQLEKAIPFGIVVGFGGPGQKKDKQGRSTGKTVAEIAAIHQEGLGTNPVRKILVDPSPILMKKMAGDMERGIQKMINKSQVIPA